MRINIKKFILLIIIYIGIAFLMTMDTKHEVIRYKEYKSDIRKTKI